MATYAALTFSPVQGFIERSRKLRDLIGASAILSHLSQQVIKSAQNGGLEVISPNLPADPQKDTTGITNRILLKGKPDQLTAAWLEPWFRDTLLGSWRSILHECRVWLKRELPEQPNYHYHWDRHWQMWGSHAWELFWGLGDSIPNAMHDLENRKLSRAWTGINWIGESSSLSGTDAIAWHELGKGTRNPKTLNWGDEDHDIEQFYYRLACRLDGRDVPGWTPDWKPPQDSEEQPEGKYIAPNEKLSLPELVKRLVTLNEIADSESLKLALPLDLREDNFSDIARRARDTKHQKAGQWTGWFMGDGDKVGDHLTKLAESPNPDEALKGFSSRMLAWGKNFIQRLDPSEGRIVYAGGDDFFGILFNPNFASEPRSISGQRILEWLQWLRPEWDWQEVKTDCDRQEVKTDCDRQVTLSVGFVWAAPNVPQRDVLQHCREAERAAKNGGRDRLALRVLFNNGQYVQWVCPWQYLGILDAYRDRDGKSNWAHVYGDLAQLKSRRAFGFGDHDLNYMSNDAVVINYNTALEFFELYFPGQKDRIIAASKVSDPTNCLFPGAENNTECKRQVLGWLQDAIAVGWYLNQR